MPACIHVQHHSRHWPSRPPLPVHCSLPFLLYQLCCLQRCLHPRIAQPYSVFLHQLLVKVPHVEPFILLPIQPQHFSHRFHRHSLRTRCTTPPVVQPVVPNLLPSFP